MWKQFLPGTAQNTISTSEYSFDYFGESVRWRIVQTQANDDYSFAIICDHRVFLRFFPLGEAKITALYFRSRDTAAERAERVFFQSMIDSCDIV